MYSADFEIDYKGTVSRSLGLIPAQERSQCGKSVNLPKLVVISLHSTGFLHILEWQHWYNLKNLDFGIKFHNSTIEELFLMMDFPNLC